MSVSGLPFQYLGSCNYSFGNYKITGIRLKFGLYYGRFVGVCFKPFLATKVKEMDKFFWDFTIMLRIRLTNHPGFADKFVKLCDFEPSWPKK